MKDAPRKSARRLAGTAGGENFKNLTRKDLREERERAHIRAELRSLIAGRRAVAVADGDSTRTRNLDRLAALAGLEPTEVGA